MGGPLKKYKVRMPSGVETVMKLNDDEAKARGLTAADLVTGSEPGPGPDGGETPGTKAAPAAPNKARTTSANKGRGARGGS
ncbi:hypothetical protein [Streptomyces decoyicus]